MTELHAELALRVDGWRRDGYAHDRYPAIAEVLTYAIEGETTGTVRYLRAAQPLPGPGHDVRELGRHGGGPRDRLRLRSPGRPGRCPAWGVRTALVGVLACALRTPTGAAVAAATTVTGPGSRSYHLATAAPQVVADDIGLPVGSLLDVGATKLQTIIDRAESKAYLDIDAELASGIDLGDLLGAAQVIFGARFAPMLALKAMTSFDDGDLPSLPIALRQRLASAAAGISRIPVMGAYRSSVSPLDPAGEDA